jgi:hypothetical protein
MIVRYDVAVRLSVRVSQWIVWPLRQRPRGNLSVVVRLHQVRVPPHETHAAEQILTN